MWCFLSTFVMKADSTLNYSKSIIVNLYNEKLNLFHFNLRQIINISITIMSELFFSESDCFFSSCSIALARWLIENHRGLQLRYRKDTLFVSRKSRSHPDASDDNRHHLERGSASNRLRVMTSKMPARTTRLTGAYVTLIAYYERS